MLILDEHKDLAEIAVTTDRSLSWLGRYAIRRLIDDYEGRQLRLHLEMPANQ